MVEMVLLVRLVLLVLMVIEVRLEQGVPEENVGKEEFLVQLGLKEKLVLQELLEQQVHQVWKETGVLVGTQVPQDHQESQERMDLLDCLVREVNPVPQDNQVNQGQLV